MYAVVAATVGAAKLLGLAREPFANAIALALVPNMAMTQTRRGPLSSWKGCAGANAARNAIFAAMLAREGFTGPTAIFEGEGGVFDIAGKFEWSLPQPGRMITRTHIKTLPVCYHGQSAVLLALDMRNRLPPERIKEIRVDAYRTAVDMMGNDPSRWAPTTHETADHSLPYTVAIAFLDGEVTEHSFDPARFTDPQVVALMQKVKVAEDPKLTALYPDGAPSRLTVSTDRGETETAEMRYPTGHAKSTIADAEVERKFRGLASKVLSAGACTELLGRLWQLDKASGTVSELTALTAT